MASGVLVEVGVITGGEGTVVFLEEWIPRSSKSQVVSLFRAHLGIGVHVDIDQYIRVIALGHTAGSELSRHFRARQRHGLTIVTGGGDEAKGSVLAERGAGCGTGARWARATSYGQCQQRGEKCG